MTQLAIFLAGTACQRRRRFHTKRRVPSHCEHPGIVGAAAVVALKAGAFFMGQLGHLRFHLGDEIGGAQREQIRIGEVAVVVRVFLRAHERGLAAIIVPAARALDEFFTAIQAVDLTLGFKLDRAAHGGH
jgi:hypothetical protein